MLKNECQEIFEMRGQSYLSLKDCSELNLTNKILILKLYLIPFTDI